VARNIKGKAILYADRVTGSMQRAIDETDRRRDKQIAFNLEHGITPTSIIKKVDDIMEAAHAEDDWKREQRKVAESQLDYDIEDPKGMAKAVKALEEKMYQHAENLEFEEAANIRDQIHKIRNQGFGINEARLR